MQWDLKRYGVIGSTNDEARILAEAGATEGTVVVAEGQTAGRGRAAHAWFSPEGKGLYASFLLRPSVDAAHCPSLSLIAGLAIADALATFAPVPAQLKWPNDVWLLGRKVGGVLSEWVQSGPKDEGRLSAALARTKDDRGFFRPTSYVQASAASGRPSSAVIVGIGLNINLRQDEFPAALHDIATSLAVVRGQPLDRELVLQALLHTVGARYRQWQHEGFVSMRADYLERSALEGRRVRVTFGAERWEGIVRGVDATGALVLETESEKTTPIIAGTVELINLRT